MLDSRWDIHFPAGDGLEPPVRGAIVSDRGANVKAARDVLVPEDSENCYCHLLDSTVRSVYMPEGPYYCSMFHNDLLIIDMLAKRLRAQPMHLKDFQSHCPAEVALDCGH